MLYKNRANPLRRRHFKGIEFQCTCCLEYSIQPKLVDQLEELRRSIKRPIIITSGYRCPYWNERVGGAANSAHMLGQAADFKLQISKDQMRKELEKLDVGYCEIRETYVHLSIRGKKRIIEK